MNKKLITEIEKIQRIIFTKEIITEAVGAVPQVLKKLLSLADDVVKGFMKSDTTDDLIKSVRKGDQLSRESIERLYRNIDWAKMVTLILDQKLLGTTFDDLVDA